MKRILLAILLLNAALSIAFAQKVTVSGKIINATTNEPLVQATVKIGEKATVTDVDGLYSLELDKAGNYNVLISYIGFENLQQNVQITPEGINKGGNLNLNFSLNEGNTLLQTTTVTAGKFEKPLSEVTVSLDVIRPQLIENVMEPYLVVSSMNPINMESPSESIQALSTLCLLMVPSEA